MPRYDAYNSQCAVFSFKQGLLSRLAHDLKFRVERFSIEFDEESLKVRATFDPSSVRVACALVDGAENTSILTPADERKILENLGSTVLEVRTYPEIRFESTKVMPHAEGYQVEGGLHLHGHSRTIRAEVRPHDDRWETEVDLHQPDFGIKPYGAALGAMKVKPDVRVWLSVPRQMRPVR